MAIPLLSTGKTPTFLETAFANKVIAVINALTGANISPDGVGSVKVGEKSVTYDLSPLANRVKALESQLANLVGNTNLSDLLKQIKDLQGDVTNINNRIVEINDRLDNATIEGSGECNDDGTVSLSIQIHF